MTYTFSISSSELKEYKSLITKETQMPKMSEKDWQKFITYFTYDTNAIEGSSVTLEEVIEILEKDKLPPYREQWEIDETYGLAEAFDRIRKTKDHISIEQLRELHRIVFKKSKSFAGGFRKLGEEVVVVDRFRNIVHRGAPSGKVVQLLTELVDWHEKNKDKYPALVLAAIVHNQFENIHPFADGNGRVGRLLMNNILLRHDMMPVNIEFINRGEYYSSLQAFEKEGKLKPTLELMVKEYEELRRILKM